MYKYIAKNHFRLCLCLGLRFGVDIRHLFGSWFLLKGAKLGEILQRIRANPGHQFLGTPVRGRESHV